MQISLRTLEDLEAKAKNAAAKVKRVQAEAQAGMQTVIGSFETTSTAFTFGVINGRWGNPEFLGVPVDLGAGLALHAAGFVVDQGGEHLHRMGDGALSSYMGALGVGVGRKMLEEAQKAAQALAAQTAPK